MNGSIRDRLIPVKGPKRGTDGTGQEPSFHILAVRLSFFTLRLELVTESENLGLECEPRSAADEESLNERSQHTIHGLEGYQPNPASAIDSTGTEFSETTGPCVSAALRCGASARAAECRDRLFD